MAESNVETVETETVEREAVGLAITLPKGIEFEIAPNVKAVAVEDVDVEIVGCFDKGIAASNISANGALYGAIVNQFAHEKEIDGKKFKVTYGVYGVEVIGDAVKDTPKTQKKQK